MASSKIIYKKMSYKIVGIMFDVIKELGSSYHEKYYQRAIEAHFKKHGISHKREQKVNIVVADSKIGHHFIDFVIHNKIVLEVKKGNYIRMADVKQVLMYLKSANLKLGLLVYFGNDGVKIKRIINSNYKK
ncbi:GxxExxY protein [Patescibacteria group bacterium]|nr:GxxExxY protein [Patescibacteria group bacterium]